MEQHFISLKEIANKFGIAEHSIKQLCKKGKIEDSMRMDNTGALMIPKSWIILEYSLHSLVNGYFFSIITLNKNSIIIKEFDNAYVSPYSIFMLENFSLIPSTKGYICDFGAGTGILGISAYLINKSQNIVFVEKENDVLELTKENSKTNISSLEAEYLNDWKHISKKKIDIILCNPASLPNIVQEGSFCCGGKYGLDMILEAVDFAKEKLTASGKLFIIITSILPRSIFFKKVISNDMTYKLISKKQIPFRSHYRGIKDWVDKLKNEYPEMYFIEENNTFFEELLLFEVSTERGK